MSNIKVSGIDQIEKRLKAMSKKAGRKMVLSVLRPVARQTRDAWRPLVPIAPAVIQNQTGLVPPGQLRKSLAVATVSARDSGLNKHTVRVGYRYKTGWYGSWVEFGTKRFSPQPAARPAYDKTKHQAFKAIGKGMWDAIKVEAKR